MAVPKFFEFFEGFLRAVADGELHTAKEVREWLASDMRLSENDCSEMLPSGKQSTFHNRVAWARTYLDRAGLIETPSRGKYRITDDGRTALASGEEINLKYLEKSEKFREFRKTITPDAPSLADEEKDESPMEMLDTAFQQITAALASQLMDEVMKLSPTEFEKLVVSLLLHMGYGSGITEAGMITQQSNDGGIDGIIKEDQLGFSSIYIQAKQWAADQTVGKPEIQKFVGALQGQQAQKGLFITTAKFSSGALQYANNLLGTKVVLVDGFTLTRLMIKHNVGVSVEHVYEMKKVDSDFFSEEL
ncbi:MAG: restriction endonuclease [Lachnospiraceae bacterium]|nr:restriction endonuclease [Lachnospiraceae bacterium]